jgi:hypothetical protein
VLQQEASLVEEWREGVEDMLDSEGLSDQLRGKLIHVSALHTPICLHEFFGTHSLSCSRVPLCERE